MANTWQDLIGCAVCVTCATSTPASAAVEPVQLVGDWQGAMTRAGVSMPISLHLEAEGRPSGRFTSLTQRTIDFPLDSVTLDGNRVHFVLGGETTFDGAWTSGGLTGTFKDEEEAGTFALHRTSPSAYPYRIIGVTFKNGDVELAGTLVEPSGSGKHAAVVLLQGSGPEVRWGTNRFIADRLARAGIAALIYDKRGSGASSGDWKTADFDDLARDALAGVDLLAHRPEIDKRWIGLHGHSQGGIIAPDAARLAPREIAFIVAEDTVAGPVWQQDLYRVRNELRDGLPPAQVDAAMQLYRKFVDVARGSEPYAKLASAEAAAVSQPWLKDLDLPPRDSWIWSWYRRTGNVDTLTYWRSVTIPTLLVYGQLDALVPVDGSLLAIGGVLDANAAPYTAIIVPGAEHNLTVHPQAGGAFFWWHGAPGYYDLLASWIVHVASVSPRPAI